jgi:hypothetical protein
MEGSEQEQTLAQAHMKLQRHEFHDANQMKSVPFKYRKCTTQQLLYCTEQPDTICDG